VTDEPTVDPEFDPPTEPRRSSFEDLSNLDVPVPANAVVTGRRTPTLITATVVLFAGAVFAALYLVLLLPFASSSERASTVSGGVVAFLVVYGIAQVIAGVLVLMLRTAGRWLGIAIAIVGIALGVIRASSTATSGLVSILLNAFVIYALASNGPSFRRE
jgi:hypothetical protein